MLHACVEVYYMLIYNKFSLCCISIERNNIVIVLKLGLLTLFKFSLVASHLPFVISRKLSYHFLFQHNKGIVYVRWIETESLLPFLFRRCAKNRRNHLPQKMSSINVCLWSCVMCLEVVSASMSEADRGNLLWAWLVAPRSTVLDGGPVQALLSQHKSIHPSLFGLV